MDNAIKLANELIDFIYDSPSAFHTVKTLKEQLNKNGFKELKECEKWDLHNKERYYVTKNDSALIAFVTGDSEIENYGFKIIGAHTDSPTFRIKPNPEMTSQDTYLKLNTERYGGLITNTWLDRPLSIAGRVILKSSDILNPETKLINIKRPIAVIPNLAIHMNRDVNKGVELNLQKDTLPIITLLNEKLEKDNYLLKLIAKELEVNIKDILDFDLYLYEFNKGNIIGADNEFISSGRLDDLAMVYAGLKAIKKCKPVKQTNVLVCFDNEEVGSSTKQGADSQFLSNVLERICIAFNKNREDFLRALSKSFMISADLAHAIHPNYEEKCDPVNKPLINKGPAIKISASQSYTSDSDSSAVYEMICNKAKVPCQKFVNRSDSRGGTTIGPISSTHLDIRSVDIGTPILAMHSIRELGGVMDNLYVVKSFEEFYEI